MSALRLAGVTAGYDGGTVLHDVHLDCPEGTVTCMIGPNGAGKSTVLRVITGLLGADAGRVTLGGTDLGALPPEGVLRAGVAMVPQSQALFPHMTVRENVLMGGYLIRRDRALVKARYAAVADLIPIVAARAGDPAGNLSGGQRRMVEVARCLMLEPRVLLFDEPSVGLDPRSLAAVTGLIERLHADGRTLLLVEQNVRLGLRLATHAVVMESGRVLMHGPAEEIAGHPQIADLYLGGRAAVPAGQASEAAERRDDG
ncbi:MAG: ATP-binding cassette domain-containing protein [Streptosporangiales bacterium]|nr:ATP-binding cassette domain-containing protein [Streptosporangiales bacterium]